ncbi:MAG TPA: hypothetical protein VJA46_02455 [Acidimicrobiia bacterium]|nr:hypothetical protein [Acidimicrobiia bacterium]
MTLYQDIRRNRRWVLIGIVLGYAMSLAVLVIRIVNTGTEPGELLGSIALAMSAAIGPSLAWLSLDRRPGLLPAAALAALITGLVTLVVLPVAFVMSLIWMQAWSSRPVKVEVSRGQWWSGVALGMTAAIAVFVLFVHLDPVCTETLADGTVLEVDAAEKGFRSGWRLGSTNSVTTQSQSGPQGPVASWCSSDRVVWGEALASLAVSLGAIGAASLWWPLNAKHAEEEFQHVGEVPRDLT